jgi:hypothetical protein
VSLADPTQRDELGSVTNAVPGLTNPYDLTVTVDKPQFATVDNGAFRYVMEFTANVGDNNNSHTLESLQIVYNAQ